MADQGAGVLLYRAPNAEEASLLAQTLGANGIATRCVGGSLTVTFGELGADALRVEIWVAPGDLEAGRAVIEGFYAERPPVEAGAAWTCSACGETNAGDFQLCWQCQTERPA